MMTIFKANDSETAGFLNVSLSACSWGRGELNIKALLSSLQGPETWQKVITEERAGLAETELLMLLIQDYSNMTQHHHIPPKLSTISFSCHESNVAIEQVLMLISTYDFP